MTAALALQPDGKLLVLVTSYDTYVYQGGPDSVTLRRFNADGSVDPTFVPAKAPFSTLDDTYIGPWQVTPLYGGDIRVDIIDATVGRHFYVHADGSRSDGPAPLTAVPYYDSAYVSDWSIAGTLPGGEKIIVGVPSPLLPADAVFAKVRSDGNLDTTFGTARGYTGVSLDTAGAAGTGYRPVPQRLLTSMSLDGQRTYVVVPAYADGTGAAIVRFTNSGASAGQMDKSFHSGGILVLPWVASRTDIADVAEQPGGGVLVMDITGVVFRLAASVQNSPVVASSGATGTVAGTPAGGTGGAATGTGAGGGGAFDPLALALLWLLVAGAQRKARREAGLSRID